MKIEQELQKYDLPDAAIAILADQYMPLKIANLEDNAGYAAVREARLIVKGKRVQVEKKRKELKEDSLRFGKAVDAEAKRITGLLEPIETHLSKQEEWFDAEKDRLKQESIRQKQEKLQARIDALKQYNQGMNIVALETMSDEEFGGMLETARLEYEFELDRQKQAEIERQKEAARLAEIAAAQEAERQRLEEIGRLQAEKEAYIISEQKRLEAEKEAIIQAEQDRTRKAEAERIRLIELDQAKKEAAEAERLRIETEALKAKELERLTKLAEERELQLLPEKEKLKNWAASIRQVAEEEPILLDAVMKAIGDEAYIRLYVIADYITTI